MQAYLREMLEHKELQAKAAIAQFAADFGYECYATARFNTAIDAAEPGTSEQDFDFATPLRIDFVLAKDCSVVLAIELEWRQGEKTERHAQQAHRKARRCSAWGLPLIRIDMTDVTPLESHLYEVAKNWHYTGTNSRASLPNPDGRCSSDQNHRQTALGLNSAVPLPAISS